MNAQLLDMDYQQEVSPLYVTKSKLKEFSVGYLKSISLITATGWSATEDAWIKYCQMLADIETHLKDQDELKIYFNLEILNATSVGYLFKIIKRLNEAHTDGKQVKVYWRCSSATCGEEMVDTGLDMAGMSDFEFQITKA
ncbi:SiaC family regulatory phosphoprotein [Ekhidna sp.]|uniref:SiaC family regulatory phosphoprotein n=1 Tax=Ekhidna sp. TaxID=2608089 RepID=UPI003CCBAB75